MDIKAIEEMFDSVNQTKEFYCKRTHYQAELLVYTAESLVKLLDKEHKIVIDVNFYLLKDTSVFTMYLSRGFRDDQHRIDQLLMWMNGIARGGYFAHWFQTGDIIFKNDFPTDYLNSTRLLKILRFFEKAYVGVKPKLETYAMGWNLNYVSDADHQKLLNDLEWHFRGVERALSD